MIRVLTLTALAATGAIGTFLLLLAGREAIVTDYARRLNRDVQDRLDDRKRIS